MKVAASPRIKLGVRSEGTAHKIRKRRGVLIALRVVVISSVAERSFLQNG